MVKLIVAMVFLIVFSMSGAVECLAASVELQWNPVADTSVTGYKVYYYQVGSPVQPFHGTGATQGASPIDAHTATPFTISGLDASHVYYFAVTAYNAAGQESVYSEIVSAFDTTAPTVSISYPANNAQVAGTVPVVVIASDNVAVKTVELYVNGVSRAVLANSSNPYLFSWDTSSFAAGTYSLVAKTCDAAGNVGTSASVTVNVIEERTTPVISITSPANNATVSGNVTITASASDSVRLSTLEIYQNGTLLAAGNISSPLSLTWDTTSGIDGNHTLVATAYDTSGNVVTSSSVTITVKNYTPTVSLTTPPSGTMVSGTVAVSASASNNVGVVRVEFHVNDILAYACTTPSCSFDWDTTTVANGTYYLTAMAYNEVGNVGQSDYVAVVTVNDAENVPALSPWGILGAVVCLAGIAWTVKSPAARRGPEI